MFVGNIGYRREGVDSSLAWKKVGRLWMDGDRTQLLMYAFPMGRIACRPRLDLYRALPGVDHYVSGDIEVLSGKYENSTTLQIEHVWTWIGHMQTNDDEKGILYWGVIEMVPVVPPPGSMGGAWCRVRSET